MRPRLCSSAVALKSPDALCAHRIKYNNNEHIIVIKSRPLGFVGGGVSKVWDDVVFLEYIYEYIVVPIT